MKLCANGAQNRRILNMEFGEVALMRGCQARVPGLQFFRSAQFCCANLALFKLVRLQKLLADCRSVKVKRLFFFFADRHQHAWLERLDKDAIDLGEGKRMLVKGGKLNKPYQITVPEDLDAVR